MNNTKQNNNSANVFFTTNLLVFVLFLANIAHCDQYCPCFNITVKSTSVVQIVSDDVSFLGEGPYFDRKNGFLYYVDLLFGGFKRLNTKTGRIEKFFISNNNDTVSIIIPYGDDPHEFIVTKNNQILKLNWETKETSVLATLPGTTSITKFNDAKADSKGRLYIGTYDTFPDLSVKSGTGRLYRWTGGDTFDLISDGFEVPNGIAFSSDRKLMYFNDSKGKRIYVFDYNQETGDLTHQRLLVSFRTNREYFSYEGPDGLVINQFGFLWTAFGSKLMKIDPKLGCIADQIELGVSLATSLADGSYKGRPGYFITTAINEVPTQKVKPTDGKLLHVSFLGGTVYGFQP